jgi:ABC-2 type transport system permease protein
MTVFRFEFKQSIKSTLAWCFGLTLLVLIFMFFYPVYANDIEIMKPLFEKLPKVILKSLGVNIEKLFTALGFYTFILLYIQLITSIQAIMLGLGIVGKEVRLKMSDFILTKPMTRANVLIQKSLAIFAHIGITWVYLSVISYAMLMVVKTEALNVPAFALFSLSTLLLQILFAGLGIVIAVLIRKLKSVVGVAMSVVFSLFVMNLMQAILDEPWLRYLSPFQWFDKTYIFDNTSYEWPMLGMWALVTIVSLAGAYVVFTRKDIHAV